MSEETWYKEGLRFECTGCGKCCTGSPGVVWVSEEEIGAMSAFLKISNEQFIQKYTRVIGERLSLLESSKTYDCVFLRDKKCAVYGARPTQCRTFPWWPQNLESKESWESVKATCEGINDEAPIVSYKNIEEQHLIQIKRNSKH
jgi:Fe-S-cluster containining protein